MNWKEGFRQPGIPAALGAALLFGAGTPLAKWLLDAVNPVLLAGLLYLGSGVGLTLYRRLSHAPAVRLPWNEVPWFAGAILAGGIVGPVLLMIGLAGMPASGASLLLNAEGVFTALLAWFAFRRTSTGASPWAWLPSWQVRSSWAYPEGRRVWPDCGRRWPSWARASHGDSTTT